MPVLPTVALLTAVLLTVVLPAMPDDSLNGARRRNALPGVGSEMIGVSDSDGGLLMRRGESGIAFPVKRPSGDSDDAASPRVLVDPLPLSVSVGAASFEFTDMSSRRRNPQPPSARHPPPTIRSLNADSLNAF
jgi:hypothetical protein